MKFEDALKLMREGKKIRCSFMPDDEYYIACYVGLKNIDDFGNEVKPTPEEFEESKSRGMSICWMKGENIHSDMKPKYIFPQDKCSINPQLHSYPQLNLLYVMADSWDIIGENK